MKEIKEALRKATEFYGDYTEARNAIAIIARAVENYENTESIRLHRGE